MAQRKSISWILKFTAELKSEQEQIKCLQANNNPAILTILQGAFDPSIQWKLPPGDPPYQPCEYNNIDNMLYTEARRLYLFTNRGPKDLNQIKREKMFIEVLESVTPDDAKLLLAVKEKRLQHEGLTAETVLKAFPGLW